MRWASAFLVCVATPLVLVAAAVFLPVGWLAVAGAGCVVAGVAAVAVSRWRAS